MESLLIQMCMRFACFFFFKCERPAHQRELQDPKSDIVSSWIIWAFRDANDSDTTDCCIKICHINYGIFSNYKQPFHAALVKFSPDYRIIYWASFGTGIWNHTPIVMGLRWLYIGLLVPSPKYRITEILSLPSQRTFQKFRSTLGLNVWISF